LLKKNRTPTEGEGFILLTTVTTYSFLQK
jgi:hypothetical protein